MEITDYFYKTSIEKNCRNFFKRIYDLPIPVSKDFVLSLIDYGKPQINEFSKVVKNSSDTFQVRNGNGIEVSGIIGGNTILFVIPKNEKALYLKFEETLIAFVKENQ